MCTKQSFTNIYAVQMWVVKQPPGTISFYIRIKINWIKKTLFLIIKFYTKELFSCDELSAKHV